MGRNFVFGVALVWAGLDGLRDRAPRSGPVCFLPGRSFADYRGFDRQLTDWLAIANARRHRAIGYRPAERIETDRAGMLPLAPIPAATSIATGIAGWSLTEVQTSQVVSAPGGS
jgi:hypothetical protein